MERRRFTPGPEEQPDNRNQEMIERVAAAVEAVKHEEKFRAYLEMLSKLHDYSPHNCLLILSQKPDATIVNSYKRWQEMGRQVKKRPDHVPPGQWGIKILYPKKRWIVEEDPETGEETRREITKGFGVGNVFDVSQTEGDDLPIPEISRDLGSSEDAAEINLRMSSYLIDDGLKMESKNFPGRAYGFYNPNKRQIVIRKDWEEDNGDPLSIAKTKTLLHEGGHYIADHRGQVDRVDAENVAESSAWVALNNLGIDTGEISFPYLAMWGADHDRLKQNAIEIGRVSRLLTEIGEGYELTPYDMREGMEEDQEFRRLVGE